MMFTLRKKVNVLLALSIILIPVIFPNSTFQFISAGDTVTIRKKSRSKTYPLLRATIHEKEINGTIRVNISVFTN